MKRRLTALVLFLAMILSLTASVSANEIDCGDSSKLTASQITGSLATFAVADPKLPELTNGKGKSWQNVYFSICFTILRGETTSHLSFQPAEQNPDRNLRLVFLLSPFHEFT